MQIPLNMKFIGTAGVVLTKDDQPPKEDGSNHILLRDVLVVALTQEFPEDNRLSSTDLIGDKIKRFSAYQNLMNCAPTQEYTNITPELATYLKGRIAKCFGVLICGPVFQLFDSGEAGKVSAER